MSDRTPEIPDSIRYLTRRLFSLGNPTTLAVLNALSQHGPLTPDELAARVPYPHDAAGSLRLHRHHRGRDRGA